MLLDVALAFALPLALTIFMPGLRSFLAATCALSAAIGWQNWAFWQTALSPDFVGPPSLPIGPGAVDLSLTGLLIGVLARGPVLALHAAKVKVGWLLQVAIFGVVAAGVWALHEAGLVHL